MPVIKCFLLGGGGVGNGSSENVCSSSPCYGWNVELKMTDWWNALCINPRPEDRYGKLSTEWISSGSSCGGGGVNRVRFSSDIEPALLNSVDSNLFDQKAGDGRGRDLWDAAACARLIPIIVGGKGLQKSPSGFSCAIAKQLETGSWNFLTLKWHS